MKKIITITFYCFSTLLLSQDFAEFSTDTTMFRHYYREGKHELPEYISEQEWFINGQRMTYGSKKIKVRVNSDQLDTVLYKGYRREEFDTIICNISEPRKYIFFYNECCGAFNIQDEESGKFIQGKVTYKLLTNDTSQLYLGTLGEAGILVNGTSNDTLKEDCRSAMSPNVYNISFRSIEQCSDSIECSEGTCLQIKGKDEPVYNYGYTTISKKVDFLFLPLISKPLTVVYDPKTDSIRIK